MDTVTERKVFKTLSEASRYASIYETMDDDGWGFKVKELRDGGYVIAVYDDEGDFIHYWGEE
jgi:hypothetical protein